MERNTTAGANQQPTGRQRLRGQVAIVTGASSGIGAATARELASQGASVVLAARRAAELDDQAQAIADAGGIALAVQTDVTRPEEIAALIERAQEHFGKIDVLVNNAGLGYGKAFARAPESTIDQMLDVNLRAVILLSHRVLPGMLERRHGAIISVASVAGHIAVDPLYSATKYGVRGFSLSLRRQLRGTGVSVSLVSPGFIRTNITRGSRIPMPGPEIIARAIARLVVHPKREVVVPGYYRPLIMLEHTLPWVADRALKPGRR